MNKVDNDKVHARVPLNSSAACGYIWFNPIDVIRELEKVVYILKSSWVEIFLAIAIPITEFKNMTKEYKYIIKCTILFVYT